MLKKFESKSSRVKCVDFHPRRPWVLASLHSGVIQLWDYRMGSLLDKFDEHDGPVRGVNFHSSQPLFVSGGDDFTIRVFNIQLRRCLYSLLGHLDYIRTVQFHPSSPWILSASDDQTIRIWNWQSRSCIAVLTGHNHYVMSACFHPKEDMVLSASLDQTVRVWDISGLRKKAVSPNSEDGIRIPQINNDLFGSNDAQVKYVLEGHDRGVNWAAFHPSLPLIISGADDRLIKLWRMNDSKAWEVDTLRGHLNNVSSVVFHPRQELILSVSEDKSIRVWDMTKRSGVQTIRREHDRFWIVAAHPQLNVFAAGHDSGLMVFKLERERPASVIHEDILYYIKDRFVRTFDFSTGRDVPIMAIRRASSSALASNPRSIAFNAAENCILVSMDNEGGTYELYTIPPKDSPKNESTESKRGLGRTAVFVARNRFAILDRPHQQIVVKNLRNEVVKRYSCPVHSCDGLFSAGAGFILIRAEDRILLFDVQARRVTADLNVPTIKYVVWSPDNEFVALISKHAIVIANRKLEMQCTMHETIRVKGGQWDERGVFLYTTLNHIKYCLPNGDGGVIRTLETPAYIVKVKGNTIFALDREYRVLVIKIDNTEYKFKLALIQKKFNEVVHMIRHSRLTGDAIIAYLQKKGYPEVALHFVKDERTKLALALECGNIEIALGCARVLDDKDSWDRLGAEALRQGNHQVVEMAYQRTKNFERLSFLYLITGNMENLSKMLKIAKMRSDVMSRFHNALYLGDAEERVEVLVEVGQVSLAYACAKAHGLEERAAALATQLGDNVPALGEFMKGKGELLFPPTPILHEDNWPLLTVSKGFFSADAVASGSAAAVTAEDDAAPDAGWGDDLDLEDGGAAAADGADAVGDELGEDGGWEDDLDLGDVQLPSGGGAGGDKGGDNFFVAPSSGSGPGQLWTQSSSLVADHVAAGSFETAMQMLNRQIGAVNFAPLKPYFLAVYLGAHASVNGVPSLPALSFPLFRNPSEGPAKALPAIALTLPPLIDRLKTAYTLTTSGKFADALNHFNHILSVIPLLVVSSRSEVNEAKELVGICREYITGIKVEMQRKEAQGNTGRICELAAYFTHCNMQPIHLMLSLRSAMNCHYKAKNFGTAASFARRLIELNPKPEVANLARKVLQLSEQNSLSNAVDIKYDEKNPFVICGYSMTPIYKGSATVQCSYCNASYLPEYKGKVCNVCRIASIGGEATGLKLM